jgi:N-acyl-D-aspartate/D-glutamate deacylase
MPAGATGRARDLLIRGSVVVDGTGAAGRRADVLVRGDRIVAVGSDVGRGAPAEVIDGDGLVLAPGFIDMHSHADHTMPSYPGALNSLAQGVTTEVVGNCGFSPAPLAEDPAWAEATRAAGRGIGPDLDWAWQRFGEYLDRVDAARPSVNAVPLVGFGTIRHAAMGAEDRPATAAERARMRALVHEALQDGAWGMSSGLVYPPGSFAQPDEVGDVAAALVGVDGIYTSHIRDEHAGLLGALDEAIGVGRRHGVRVHVSHLKSAGRANHGRAPAALALLDEARAAGLRVTQDVYPYLAASTMLSQLVPPWVHDGGVAELIQRLRSEAVRGRIRDDIEHGLPGWANYTMAAGGWEGIRIAAVVEPRLRAIEGLTVAEAARRTGREPLTLVLDTLVEDHASTTMILSLMDERDMLAIVDHPVTAIGSDQLGVTSRGARVHPRAYGSFVRVLALARERGTDLAAAVHRMSGLSARILGLPDRGSVRAGAVADLVLFDPVNVTDRATYEQPTLLPAGVEAVMVGGAIAMRRGGPVRVDLGRVLRRG